MNIDRHVQKLLTFGCMCNELKSLSTCKRAQVSSIIIPFDCSRILAIGYNGPVSGVDNDSCSGLEGQCGCVHAEANALIKLNPFEVDKCILISTTAPCIECAKLIANTACIKGVLYYEPYRNNDGLMLIRDIQRSLFDERIKVDALDTLFLRAFINRIRGCK